MHCLVRGFGVTGCGGPPVIFRADDGAAGRSAYSSGRSVQTGLYSQASENQMTADREGEREREREKWREGGRGGREGESETDRETNNKYYIRHNTHTHTSTFK